MKRYLITCLAGATLLGACSNNNTPPLAGAYRLVNGVPDSGGLSSSATSGFPSSSTAGFDSASSIVDVPDGGYNVQVTPGSGATFTVDNVGIQHNNLTTLFTYGSTASSTAAGFTAEENLSTPASGTFTFQFVNDTSQTATAALSIFLIPVGAGIGSATPVATASTATASQDVNVPAGTYEIVVASAGAPVYDSGTTGGITLPTPDTNVIQIGALDATAAQVSSNGSPITLLLLDNNGGEALHLSGQN
jgi:hypothetical protein